MVVFTCDGKDGHSLCLDCFKEFARLALTERRFIENAQSGYSIQCPSNVVIITIVLKLSFVIHIIITLLLLISLKYTPFLFFLR